MSLSVGPGFLHSRFARCHIGVRGRLGPNHIVEAIQQ